MVQVLKEPCAESEPILSATTTDSFDDPKSYRKNSYAEEAYKNITSSMNAEPLQIENLDVALNLFATAVKVQNVPLAKQCLEILDTHINKQNVLIILSYLAKCKMPTSNPNDYQPSAPPIVENDNQLNVDWVQELIDNLRNTCLLEIDKNGDYILKQKAILNLSYTDILEITSRDTLQVSNELLVYSAIMRWCIEECKRRTLETQLVNINAVLRELVYAPRYGLMTQNDFKCRTVDGVKGPNSSGILEEQERTRILKYLKKYRNSHKLKPPPIEELPFKGSSPRVGCQRRDSTKFCNKSTCEKWLINFLTCWTAVFD